jgi:hypothetical protein
MTSKKRVADSDDGVEWMTGSGGGSNRPLPRVNVLQRGLVLSVYPDKATLETMREENWISVTVGFRKNEAGETTELLLRAIFDRNPFPFVSGDRRACTHLWTPPSASGF